MKMLDKKTNLFSLVFKSFLELQVSNSGDILPYDNYIFSLLFMSCQSVIAIRFLKRTLSLLVN